MKKIFSNVFSRKNEEQKSPHSSRPIGHPGDSGPVRSSDETTTLSASPLVANPYRSRFKSSKDGLISVDCGEEKKLRRINVEKIKPQCKVLYALVRKPAEERRIALPDVTTEDLDTYIKYSNLICTDEDGVVEDMEMADTMVRQLNWEEITCIAITTEKLQDKVLRTFIEGAIAEKGMRVKYLASKLFGGDVVEEVYTRTEAGSWVRRAFAKVASHSKTFTRSFEDADDFVEDVTRVMKERGSAGVYDEDSDSDGYDVCRTTKDTSRTEMLNYEDESEGLPLYESDSDEEVAQVKTVAPAVEVKSREKQPQSTKETRKPKPQQPSSKKTPPAARTTPVLPTPQSRPQASSPLVNKQFELPFRPLPPSHSQRKPQSTSATPTSSGNACARKPELSSVDCLSSARISITPQQPAPAVHGDPKASFPKTSSLFRAQGPRPMTTLQRKVSTTGDWRNTQTNSPQQTSPFIPRTSLVSAFNTAPSAGSTSTANDRHGISSSQATQASAHLRNLSLSQQQIASAPPLPRSGTPAETRPSAVLPPILQQQPSISQRIQNPYRRTESETPQDQPRYSLRSQSSGYQRAYGNPTVSNAQDNPPSLFTQQRQARGSQQPTSQGYTRPQMHRQSSASPANPPLPAWHQFPDGPSCEPVNPSNVIPGLRQQMEQIAMEARRNATAIDLSTTFGSSLQRNVRRIESQNLREQAVRQPRNPVAVEELTRAPTLNHRGSRNFAVRKSEVQTPQRF